MSDYDQSYFSNLEKGEEVEIPRNLRLLLLIEEYIPKGKVLDIGVGTGLFLKLAKKRGWQIFGIDVSEYAISKLIRIFKSKKQSQQFIQGELDNNSFPENSFNAVNMRHSIEHLKNPTKTLKIIKKILKPGGVVCIATPNSFGVHAKVFGRHWPHWSLAYHLQFFSKKSLRGLVEDCGFQVKYIGTEELSSYDLFRLMVYRLGIPISYGNPTKFTKTINNTLAKVGLGEGLVLVAQKIK